MTAQESIRQAARLRFRMHLNARLRLETLAALSRVFREYGEPIHEELLGSLVFAVPQELLGEAQPVSSESGFARPMVLKGKPPIPPPEPGPGRPTMPPPQPRPEPGRPTMPPPHRPEPGRPTMPPPGKK